LRALAGAGATAGGASPADGPECAVVETASPWFLGEYRDTEQPNLLTIADEVIE
jgi:hypothetical protein